MADSDIEKKQYICKNCGAIISVNDHKCPYCDGFNYVGAKKKYFRDLNHIKDNLEELEEIPNDSYKKETSFQIRRIVKTLLICVLITALIYAAISLFTKWEDSKYSLNQADPKDQLLWDRKNFPILDEWYELGEYDKLMEFNYGLYSEDIVYTLTNWEHEDFIRFYEDYLLAKKAMDRIENKEKYSLYDITTAIYGGLNICYNLDNAELDEDEIARLEVYKPAMKTLLFDILEFTEEEALQLYNDTSEYSFLNYEKIKDYAGDVIIKRLD